MERSLRGKQLQVFNEVKKLMKNLSADHDISHISRVTRTASVRIGLSPYPNRLPIKQDCVDIELITVAALLHDVDDHKLFQGSEDLSNARRILKEVRYCDEFSDKVCHIIEQVSFSKNHDKIPDSVEAMVVQDADRLDAIGAVGIARAFAYSGATNRTLDDTLMHFYEKLFKIKGMLNTEAAKQIAEERHEFMKTFINNYVRESGISPVHMLNIQNAYL